MNVKTMKDFGDMTDAEARSAAAQFTKDGQGALARLVKLAVDGDSGQAARVGNFLLAWWNASRDGGFDFTHLWNVDESVARDMMTVTALFTLTRSYADSYGYQQEMEKFVGFYSQKKRRRRLH